MGGTLFENSECSVECVWDAFQRPFVFKHLSQVCNTMASFIIRKKNQRSKDQPDGRLKTREFSLRESNLTEVNFFKIDIAQPFNLLLDFLEVLFECL